MSSLATDFLDRFTEQWLNAWNDHDVAAIQAMCAPDVVLVDPATPEPMTRWAEAEEGLTRFFGAFPDFHVDRARWYVSPTDPEVMIQWQFSATMLGPLPPGFAPTNARVQLEGATRICFSDELVSEAHWFYDVMDLGRQIGAAPEPGSMAERSGVWMQHMKARKLRKLTPA